MRGIISGSPAKIASWPRSLKARAMPRLGGRLPPPEKTRNRMRAMSAPRRAPRAAELFGQSQQAAAGQYLVDDRLFEPELGKQPQPEIRLQRQAARQNGFGLVHTPRQRKRDRLADIERTEADDLRRLSIARGRVVIPAFEKRDDAERAMRFVGHPIEWAQAQRPLRMRRSPGPVAFEGENPRGVKMGHRGGRIKRQSAVDAAQRCWMVALQLRDDRS